LLAAYDAFFDQRDFDAALREKPCSEYADNARAYHDDVGAIGQRRAGMNAGQRYAHL